MTVDTKYYQKLIESSFLWFIHRSWFTLFKTAPIEQRKGKKMLLKGAQCKVMQETVVCRS